VGSAVTAVYNAPGLNLEGARIVWEARDQEPHFGTDNTFTFFPTSYGTQWVEVEIQWPDGRRAFAAQTFMATNDLPTVSLQMVRDTAKESDGSEAVLRFTRSGPPTNDLTIYLDYGGTATLFDDYRTDDETVPDSVIIPAGQNSVTLSFYAVDDSEPEFPETVIVSLLEDSGYNIGWPASGTFTILDNDLGLTDGHIGKDGTFKLTWTTEAGRYYMVYSTPTLGNSNWQPLSGWLQASGGSISWSDNSPSRVGQRFYAIAVAP
jgi:hypothetical protein